MGILNLNPDPPPPKARTPAAGGNPSPQTAGVGDGPGDAASPVPGQPTKPLVSDPVATLKFKPRVLEVLATVFDPEIPVNIYELGLIYDVVVDADHAVRVMMTLTAPNCPAAQILPGEVKTKVAAVEGVTDASVEVVWEPAWTPERMSDAAKLQLGML
ncbi:MAG TPA: hypothetical protein DCP38_03915 [Acidobacteria bacterium]|nr:hypothetical protein [Acidobacteriota bacterium]HAK54620.1 hypothetical protein [Acidobacteriota bacterium]